MEVCASYPTTLLGRQAKQTRRLEYRQIITKVALAPCLRPVVGTAHRHLSGGGGGEKNGRLRVLGLLIWQLLSSMRSHGSQSPQLFLSCC